AAFLSTVSPVGFCLAGDCIALPLLHAGFRLSVCAWAGGPVEGTRSRRCDEPAMTQSGELRSGKGAGDENFPVASRLIKRRHRPVIVAFSEVVRVADDIADHPTLASDEKITRLNRLQCSLL